MRAALAALLFVTLLGVTARRCVAACQPTTDPDKTDIADARAAVAANCDCAHAASHSAYVGCAGQQAGAVLQNKDCRRVVVSCAAKSTCGRPGFVTCCRTKPRKGQPVTGCSVRKDAAPCTPPAGGGACVGSVASCCDACPTGGCATTTTTTTTLPPCDMAATTACGGTCPPMRRCVLLEDPQHTFCGCIPDGTQACADAGFPFCNGQCPTAQHCGTLSRVPDGPCACVPDGTTACGDATFPTCGGVCTGTDACGAFRASTYDFCSCVSPTAACQGMCLPTPGLCPPGEVCNLASVCACTAP